VAKLVSWFCPSNCALTVLFGVGGVERLTRRSSIPGIPQIFRALDGGFSEHSLFQLRVIYHLNHERWMTCGGLLDSEDLKNAVDRHDLK
jgi:hypothetical protein